MVADTNNEIPTAPAAPEDEWAALAVKAQKGDKVANNRLLLEISPFIKNYLLPTLANPDWADDITQNVLISVHKSLKTFSPSRPFRPWLIAIINFRRLDYLRRFYNRRGDSKTSLDNPDFIKNYVTEPDVTGEYIDIERALDALPTKQRAVFRKVKIEGHSIHDVAEEMGMSESAVKVSAHRTMKKIQEFLK